MKFLIPWLRRHAWKLIGLVLTGGFVINFAIYNITNNNYYNTPNHAVQAPAPGPSPVAKVVDPVRDTKEDKTEKRIKTRNKKANHSNEIQKEWSNQVPVQNPNSIFNTTPSYTMTVSVQPQQVSAPSVYAQQTQSQSSSSYARNTNTVIVQQASQQRQVIIVQQAPAIRYLPARPLRYGPVPFGFRRYRRY